MTCGMSYVENNLEKLCVQFWIYVSFCEDDFMFTRFKFFGLLFLCLASCGPSQIQLYTYSYPAGASVTQQGKVIGEDGNSLYYNITDAHREQG